MSVFRRVLAMSLTAAALLAASAAPSSAVVGGSDASPREYPAVAARSSTGALRVVGTTSFGDGCARPGKPGVYARVAGDLLRPWIAVRARTRTR